PSHRSLHPLFFFLIPPPPTSPPFPDTTLFRFLLAVGVQEHRAVGACRLRDRVALHGRGPGAAVRVVLERVEVARLGAEREREPRSEEHTSELQSRGHLVCRLLLEKKTNCFTQC